MSVLLTVANGTISVTPGASTVLGNGTASVVVSGSLADVNAALASIKYQGTANYNGTDTLTVKADDRGNTGVGGPKITTGTVDITLASVNDPPVYNGTLSDVTVNEDSGTLTFNLGTAFTDPDVGIGAGDLLTYTITLVDQPDAYVRTAVIDTSGLTGATINSNVPVAGQETVVYTTTASSLVLPLMKDAHGKVSECVDHGN